MNMHNPFLWISQKTYPIFIMKWSITEVVGSCNIGITDDEVDLFLCSIVQSME